MIFVCRHAKSLQSVQLFATSWTVTYQALLSMGFPRKEYWSWLPCPALGDLPDSGIKTMSLMSPALAGRFFTTSATYGPPKREGTVSQVFFCFPSQANSRLSRK